MVDPRDSRLRWSFMARRRQILSNGKHNCCQCCRAEMLCALCEMRCEKEDMREVIDLAQKSEAQQIKLQSGKRKRKQFSEEAVYDAVRPCSPLYSCGELMILSLIESKYVCVLSCSCVHSLSRSKLAKLRSRDWPWHSVQPESPRMYTVCFDWSSCIILHSVDICGCDAGWPSCQQDQQLEQTCILTALLCADFRHTVCSAIGLTHTLYIRTTSALLQTLVHLQTLQIASWSCSAVRIMRSLQIFCVS
jgi:hypothetical protein